MGWHGDEIVVDFRCRPNTPECLGYLEAPQAKRVMALSKTTAPPAADLDGFLAHLSAIGVDRAVFFGYAARDTSKWAVGNDYVARVVDESKGRIMGFAGVAHTGMAGLRAVVHAVDELGLRGISLEPFGNRLAPDDRTLYPIYAKCCELGVAVSICAGPMPYAGMSGVEGPPLSCADPIAIDRVATDFPELRLVLSHTSWPWVEHVVALAVRHPNVYFDTLIYYGWPGNEVLAAAINRLVPDRVLFSSGFPIVPIEQARAEFESSGVHPEFLPAAFGANARRLLEETGAW
jgi:predicted TIM-barrel fold metal-dependent hydrolase